eukprot:CAMPEP_0179873044 /NCGR_PEP_ID=MMETSP0982-20121206/21891_1 /TAXON_ID=483367 /ORGANISM="non described non described, Strain CCMP 2436" /LENGTH=147 /DNA_ID=CAMNT_0021764239 /DNA_START=34 /DNA_END=474 /DNA_ORIENTATION=+
MTPGVDELGAWETSLTSTWQQSNNGLDAGVTTHLQAVIATSIGPLPDDATVEAGELIRLPGTALVTDDATSAGGSVTPSLASTQSRIETLESENRRLRRRLLQHADSARIEQLEAQLREAERRGTLDRRTLAHANDRLRTVGARERA